MGDTEALGPAIEALLRKIEALDREAVEAKKGVNLLSKLAGRPEPFPDIAEATRGRGFVPKPDEFANENAPSAAVRSYLELRGQAAGAATLEEIFSALKVGGFFFQAKDDKAAIAGLRVAVGKDEKLTKLQNGTVGLASWYPRRAPEKRREKGLELDEEPAATPEESEESAAEKPSP